MAGTFYDESAGTGTKIASVGLPILAGLAAASHPAAARGLAGLTHAVGLGMQGQEQQRQAKRERQLREGLGGLRLRDTLDPEEAQLYQALIQAAPAHAASALLPRLAEATRRRREQQALAGLEEPLTVERETQIPGAPAVTIDSPFAYATPTPARRPDERRAFFESLTPKQQRNVLTAGGREVFQGPPVMEPPAAPRDFYEPQAPLPSELPAIPATTRLERVPVEQAPPMEQLRARRARRAQYETALGGLTEERRAVGERRLKRLDEEIARQETRVTRQQVNRLATELRRANPALSPRDAELEALREIQAETGFIPSGFDKLLPEKPESPRLTQVDLALAAAAGDEQAKRALDALNDRDRAQTQVDLALRAAGGDRHAEAALRLLRPEDTDIFIRPVVEETTHELILIGIDKRTGRQKFTTRTGVKANVTADALSQILAAYGISAPPGAPAAVGGPSATAEEEARRYLEGR